MSLWKDKFVIIAGASSGTGEATVRRLTECRKPSLTYHFMPDGHKHGLLLV